MLAGCSSTLLSPKHRLRSEASTQFQACHIPTMSTQRLDLPRSFARKDSTSKSQPIRPVGLSVEKPIEAKTSGCSLRQNIRLPPVATESRRVKKDEFWEQTKSTKKRYAGEVSYEEENSTKRVKREKDNERSDVLLEDEKQLSLVQLSSENFWFDQGFSVPISVPFVPFSVTCSGEEDSFLLVTSDVIAQPLPPLSNVPWFDSVVTEITELGDDQDVGIIKCSERDVSASSASSDSRGLVLGLRGNPAEHEVGNVVPSPPKPVDSSGIVLAARNVENNPAEHDCIELISLLVICAEQIGSRNITGISHCLARLGELASPRGSSVIHRLAAYYTEALALRVARQWPLTFQAINPLELDHVFDDEYGTVLRFLNQISPLPKFIHFTSNEILLRAFEGKDRVHIIDFDIKQGLQWPSLFQSLASRHDPPSHVRITGIGESKHELIETGERLSGFAEALHLPFEFHPVVDRLEDIRLWMLHVKENETVAVNCIFQLHKMLYDTTEGTIHDFLGLIRSMNAEAVIIAEQEADHNRLSLDARLISSLKYYAAIFDVLDSSLPLDSKAMIKIEEMFGQEIRNIIACEGRDRLERHENFDKWQQRMEKGGFRCMGISQRELLQGQMILKMYDATEDYYSVQKQEKRHGAASLTLSWQDQPLYSVSAWTKPLDDTTTAEGSSSQLS